MAALALSKVSTDIYLTTAQTDQAKVGDLSRRPGSGDSGRSPAGRSVGAIHLQGGGSQNEREMPMCRAGLGVVPGRGARGFSGPAYLQLEPEIPGGSAGGLASRLTEWAQARPPVATSRCGRAPCRPDQSSIANGRTTGGRFTSKCSISYIM